MICPSCGHDNLEGMDRCENCLASFRDLDVPRSDNAAGLARSVMEDDLRQLPQEETLFVTPNTPAIEVVRRMKTAQTGCALVLDTKDNRLKGIFTEHDVLTKMTPLTAPADQVEVKDLMSPNPETLRETDSVAAALNKMSLGRFRHIPVIKNDGGYSVVSIKSVLQYIAREDW
jgi:CBS domain-containing protein